jgi:hypothetical protein
MSAQKITSSRRKLDAWAETRALMRSRLDAALKALALPTNYVLVDVDKLDASDRRRGYGTPTVLYMNRDLFDKPMPAQATAPS